MPTEFTPGSSLVGGLLIGLGAVLLMLGPGRILGAIGIVSGAVYFENKAALAWRLALIVGMILAPGLHVAMLGTLPSFAVSASPAMILFGGAIVGLGASLGSGCTSGHGICGLARLSKRSLAAVLTFMATAAGTVYLIRHGIGG